MFTNYYNGDSIDEKLESNRLQKLYEMTVSQLAKSKRLQIFLPEIEILQAEVGKTKVREIDW